MKSFLTKAAILLAGLLFSCDNNDDPGTACLDTVCTLIFISVFITIEDTDQNPVVLDSFEVIDVATGAPVELAASENDLEIGRQQGFYPLVDDLSFGLREQHTLLFRGFMDGQEVIQSTYEVATDCCHVGLNSGDLELVLD